MNTMNSILYASTIAGCLVFHSGVTHADAPPPESFNKPAELILTLSDQWLQADNPDGAPHAFKRPNRNNANKAIPDSGKHFPINVDCGMDVSPYAGNDNSLTGRLSGECDLHYHY